MAGLLRAPRTELRPASWSLSSSCFQGFQVVAPLMGFHSLASAHRAVGGMECTFCCCLSGTGPSGVAAHSMLGGCALSVLSGMFWQHQVQLCCNVLSAIRSRASSQPFCSMLLWRQLACLVVCIHTYLPLRGLCCPHPRQSVLPAGRVWRKGSAFASAGMYQLACWGGLL